MRLDQLDRSLRSVGTSKAEMRNSPKRPVEVQEDRDVFTPFEKMTCFSLNLFHCGRHCKCMIYHVQMKICVGFGIPCFLMLSWPFFPWSATGVSSKERFQVGRFMSTRCTSMISVHSWPLSPHTPTSFNTSCFLCLKVENPQPSDVSPGSISKLFASKVVDPSSLQENSADLSLVLW